MISTDCRFVFRVHHAMAGNIAAVHHAEAVVDRRASQQIVVTIFQRIIAPVQRRIGGGV